ncbi:Protein of unknown function DUF616, partial [Dillenia turbinata]
YPPPPPASVFLGYTLPSDHPCEKFTLPSPPADKKRTGPKSFDGSAFGGYPTLKQRNESCDIKDLHCGFVGGTKPGHNTGFDIDESDLLEMEQCREEVVASAIFGNYDVIQQPKSEAAKKNA